MLKPLALMIALMVPLSLVVSSGATAQTNQRTAYIQNRAKFDALVMQRKIGDAMALIATTNPPTADQIAAMNAELMKVYSTDFTGSETVRSDALKGGFRQEMFAYWNDAGQYLYVFVLMHRTNDAATILSIKYDSDFHALYGLF